MPIDKVKPLKIEDALKGTELDQYPKETDPTEDHLSAKGIAFEGNEVAVVHADSGVMKFKDSVETTVLTLNQLAGGHRIAGRAVASTTPTNGQAVVWDNSGSTWKPGTINTNAARSIDVTFGAQVSTTATTHTTFGTVLFQGSNTTSSPVGIRAIGFVSASTVGAIRVYDVTNAKVIAENITISNTTKGIINLGTISNIPAGEAIWEIQIRKVSGSSGNQIVLHYLGVFWS